MKVRLILPVIILSVLFYGNVWAINNIANQESKPDISDTKSESGRNATDKKGSRGGLPAERKARIAADEALQLQIDANSEAIEVIELIPGPPGPQGPQGEQGPSGEGQTINLTIDPAQFPGITAQDFQALFSDTVLNTTILEVVGHCAGPVVVINGPAVEIQVVEGFDELGRHDDQSGLAQELPFVIEALPPDPQSTYAGCESDLIDYFDNFEVFGPKALSLLIFNSSGGESFRWNLFEFEPDGYTAGIESTRFTFRQKDNPDNYNRIQREGPNPPGSQASYNPATDLQVDIEGAPQLYPNVVEQTDRVLTLVYDFVEGGGDYFSPASGIYGIWGWTESIADLGTSELQKRSISVITQDENGNEVSRINYFGCFPIKYEQFAGFVQDLQTKERIIINCDFSMPGQ